MSGKRADLCPNTQASLLAEEKADGTKFSKRDDCPYCGFKIGAHNMVEQSVVAASSSTSAAGQKHTCRAQLAHSSVA